MYQVDDRDRVKELDQLPQSSVGAPQPLVVSTERSTLVAYYANDPEEVHHVPGRGELSAIVRFDPCYAMTFGPPNDEAFGGHPLASRGLEPYGFFEIEDSSWIRSLERMNRVHDKHDPAGYLAVGRRHYVLSFHDSTFECIARAFTLLKLAREPHLQMVSEFLEL